MVGFFPTPYPDECLYSILCRYYARGGYGNYESCIRELYGGIQTLTLSVFLPMKIEYIDGWVSPSSGVTRRDIAVNHTLYGYWAVTYPENFRADMDTAINGGVSSIETNNIGSLLSRRSWAKHLKYCPLCAAEDVETYGEPYWHRQHQLAEMLYCVKHEVRLVNSAVNIRQTATGFYPALHEVNTLTAIDAVDNLAAHKTQMLRVGRESEWLIKHGLEVDWSANGHEKYWKLLRDKGLASVQGRCDYPALDTAFNDYWGKDFIEILFDETADTRFKGWTYQIDKNKMRSYIPLYHILLMCFLAGSIAHFVESTPADTPYGHPPFDCENPVCPQYHIDGAEMVSLSYYGNGARAIFECSDCGMRYKINKSKHSRELRVILEYGEVWEREFRRCCQDKAVTNEKAAEIFKCDESVIWLQKKKRGLLRQPPYYGSDVSASDYYKAEVEAVCAEHAEVTIGLLNKQAPGAYEYLKDHDYEWIRNRIVFENEQRHIREYEAQLLISVQSVVEQLKTDGYPKRQVTYGYIAKLAGSARDKLRCRDAVRNLLDGIVESKSDWLKRRTLEICRERAEKTTPTTIKTIKWVMTLKTRTGVQYQTVIQEAIDEFYERNN